MSNGRDDVNIMLGIADHLVATKRTNEMIARKFGIAIEKLRLDKRGVCCDCY